MIVSICQIDGHHFCQLLCVQPSHRELTPHHDLSGVEVNHRPSETVSARAISFLSQHTFTIARNRRLFNPGPPNKTVVEEPIVIYRGEDGQWWARPVSEFDDGRFERVQP